VTRRQRLDLELLLIIRRAERQARLLGGSPFNQPDAVIIVRSTERVTLTDLPVAQERASAACANSADEDSRIARPDGAPRVVRVAGADVDVQVLDLDGLLLVPLPPGGTLRGDHARHEGVARQDLDALAEQYLRVPAAEPAEGEVAALVRVRDGDADLVEMAEDGKERPAAGPGDAGHRVADGVAGDLGELAGGFAPHCGGGSLVTRRAGYLEELAEKVGDRQGRPHY